MIDSLTQGSNCASWTPPRQRVLITGHRGFLGRHLWARLAPDADYLIGCDLKSGQDCRDFFRFDNTPFDLVLHCAATIGGREGIDGNAAMLAATNMQLDGAMFEWALRTMPGRVVYFSSSAAYPVLLQNGHRPNSLIERDIGTYVFEPDASYGFAKLHGERLARDARKAGVPVTVVRPFSCYGTDQDDCYPFPQFIARARRRDVPFDVWGDGTQVRDWIHVDDLVEAVVRIAGATWPGPVNIGTGVGTSMDELADLCMSEMGAVYSIRHLIDKPTGVQHRVADVSLLSQIYTPKITLQEGVRRALAEN